MFDIKTTTNCLSYISFRDNHQPQQKLLCDPCLCGNIQTEATSFCITCKEPEAFCEDCAQLHSRQRATKGHELSSDKKKLLTLCNTSNTM